MSLGKQMFSIEEQTIWILLECHTAVWGGFYLLMWGQASVNSTLLTVLPQAG